MGDLQFRLVKPVQSAAKMDDHQIALMAQQRKQRGWFLFVLFHRGESGDGPVEDMLLIRIRQSAPRRPAHAEHLMQDKGAVQGERRRGRSACR